MRRVWTLAVAGLALLAWTSSGAARIHGQMYCWDPDSEFPVPCGREDDEEEAAGTGLRDSGYPCPETRISWPA
jgi:hypothetical protein